MSVAGVAFGATAFCTDRSDTPAEVAVAAERAGFQLLLFPDHTHVPCDRRVAYPGGGELPAHYLRTHDPLIASAWASGSTSTLQVGVGVCLVTARDPIVLAKQVASLDHMSGGRFVLGVGVGWNVDEVANHGVAPDERWAVMRERVLAMRRIWTEDQAEFRGEHVRFAPLWSWPKPDGGRPRIMVGGHGDRVIDRVLEYGDEWLVQPSPGRPPLRDRVIALRQRAEALDRPRPLVSCQLYGRLRPELVERMVDAGVDRIDLAIPHGPPSSMTEHLEALGDEIARYR